MLWDSITEESSDIAMECSSFQMLRGLGSRRQNVDVAMHEMAVDELSFYDDEDESCGPRSSSHSYAEIQDDMGLLSPEGPAQRFHIVEKRTLNANANGNVNATNKFRLPSTQAHKQKNGSEKSVSSSCLGTPPTKSFRVFNSLSSESMESSIDDEYMELFEMESLEQSILGESVMRFPSDLNSLISGEIKSSTLSIGGCGSGLHTPTVGTLETRRPSVRRCLSMTDNYQQTPSPMQAPKTPDVLKRAPESTTPFAARNLTERNNMNNSNSNSLTPLSSNNCFKRPDPPSTTCSPVQVKRYRGHEKENEVDFLREGGVVATSCSTTVSSRVIYRKSMSMNDAEIMTALARSENKDEPDLIGDFSKPFVLPLMDGRHRDLKSISSDTMARLLRGEFDEKVASYRIIDCRYPYEFEGGHIRGAQNLYTQEQIIEEFLTPQKTEPAQPTNSQQMPQGALRPNGGKRHIIIFHCEFSSERGPKLSRFLRNNDRARNTNSYPTLSYPEIYLLHNGYKEFYEQYAELCDPVAYRPMLEPSYNDAYRHFRAKSKSWNGDGLGGATTRLKKSRSRLML